MANTVGFSLNLIERRMPKNKKQPSTSFIKFALKMHSHFILEAHEFLNHV